MVFDKKYSDEVRQRAVERVRQRRLAEPENRSIVREVAEEFEVGPQSLRKWLTRYDDGSYDYDSTSASASMSTSTSTDGHGGGREPRAAPAGSQERGAGRRELLARISELEHHVAVLREDNRSLTRVVALLADQLRVATTNGVQIPDSAVRPTPRA
ncbi:transposase [Streptomyces sp. NRRL F-5135]|uniref:transposase n=1 Tax=Streptomyces sp. NRRL F-5135 TaxID=1463858 RepID=UPI0004C77F0C|nr:transposase [Streptomyces sp. NRRL F-5135]